MVWVTKVGRASFFFFLMRMGLDKVNGLPHEIGSMEANKIVTT